MVVFFADTEDPNAFRALFEGPGEDVFQEAEVPRFEMVGSLFLKLENTRPGKLT